MSMFREAKCWVYLGDNQEKFSFDVEVRIEENGEIAVSYEDDQGPCAYVGQERGAGHFLLECPERQGRGSLHRFPEGLILEGFWSEGGVQGMWRVELSESAELVSGEPERSETSDAVA